MESRTRLLALKNFEEPRIVGLKKVDDFPLLRSMRADVDVCLRRALERPFREQGGRATFF